MKMRLDSTRELFVRHIYADHNDSPKVQQVLRELLATIPPQGRCLNVGAGSDRLYDGIVNLDIVAKDDVGVVADAQMLPFRDNCFDLVISQETLEHVADPFAAIREIYRVLIPGGRLYIQLPFIIGYHPGPTDFWRFTTQGIAQLCSSAGFEIESNEVSVGPAFGFYRIAVEFVAVGAASIWSGLYIPAKACAAAVLFPMKLSDGLFRNQRDRIAGGYLVVARK